ncbi:AraC family transcriptional regulator [Litoreibacter meonggei]|uniref:AraC family transcriptional regulator n=1 Tax=Litoreibacter meonggei TaxID=1049199 RepID=A0A497VCW4_9RHOB|nr:AraC family transcriptional regulator [Litoreibacter meonggei]RLJ41320.1 AraC family transcriptional regulator [Litoreibacter meonggei]
MDLIIAEMISTATIAIAVFGIVFCLMQAEFTRVSRSFAAFLAAVAVNNLPGVLNRLFQSTQNMHLQPADLILWLSSSLCLAPLFWIYVVTLTSSAQKGPAHLYRHFVLPALAVLVGLVMILSPQGLWAEVITEDILQTYGWWSGLIVAAALLELAVYPQMAIYLFLIIRRMMRYRLLLRDVYASTEEHEMRWIYVIGGLGALFWVAQALILLIAFDLEQPRTPPAVVTIAGLAGLGLVATMTLWGLRQRPPLVPDPDDRHPPENAEDQTGEKYEKSALSTEASTRIARKLRAAMEKDHLHRDPNLSLWVLARHIGASPNYISQTLNEVVGENFFDFVNGYRIAEAKARLATTDDSVLTITYDVGFNARSSFYNAFKRVTGETPTRYRKTLSHRDGMDDVRDGLRDF